MIGCSWFEIKYNPSYLGLYTKVLNESDADFTEKLQSFLTYKGELGIRYGFIPGPILLTDKWQILSPTLWREVELSSSDTRGIENFNEVCEKYQTNKFIELTIAASDLRKAKIILDDVSQIGDNVLYSEALIPAFDRPYDPANVDERILFEELLSGYLRVFTTGHFKIYIPKVPKTFCIYLRGYKVKTDYKFLNYQGSIYVSEVNLSEGLWGAIEPPASPFYWDPGIIRVGLVSFLFVSLISGYDALGLGSLGIDRETWDRFKLLYSTYEGYSDIVTLVMLSGYLRDEFSTDLQIALDIANDVKEVEKKLNNIVLLGRDEMYTYEIEEGEL